MENRKLYNESVKSCGRFMAILCYYNLSIKFINPYVEYYLLTNKFMLDIIEAKEMLKNQTKHQYYLKEKRK